MSGALLALIHNRLSPSRHATYVVRAAAGLQPTISIRRWKVFDGGRSDKVSCLKLILRLLHSSRKAPRVQLRIRRLVLCGLISSWHDILYSVRRDGRAGTTHCRLLGNYAYFFTGGG